MIKQSEIRSNAKIISKQSRTSHTHTHRHTHTHTHTHARARARARARTHTRTQSLFCVGHESSPSVLKCRAPQSSVLDLFYLFGMHSLSAPSFVSQVAYAISLQTIPIFATPVFLQIFRFCLLLVRLCWICHWTHEWQQAEDEWR